MSDQIKKIELADGRTRYRFVIGIGRDPATGKRRQRTKTFDTKRQARDEYARIRHHTGQGTFVAPKHLTLNAWLDTWLPRPPSTWKRPPPSTTPTPSDPPANDSATNRCSSSPRRTSTTSSPGCSPPAAAAAASPAPA